MRMRKDTKPQDRIGEIEAALNSYMNAVAEELLGVNVRARSERSDREHADAQLGIRIDALEAEVRRLKMANLELATRIDDATDDGAIAANAHHEHNRALIDTVSDMLNQLSVVRENITEAIADIGQLRDILREARSRPSELA